MSAEERLTQEIFQLAYHLHWSHAEILGLAVGERARYLALLEEQFRREREAIERNSRK